MGDLGRDDPRWTPAASTPLTIGITIYGWSSLIHVTAPSHSLNTLSSTGCRVCPRHAYAPLVLEAGESVVTLAQWLGHSSPTITLDHYAHFMPEAGKKGRRAIDSLLGEPTEEPSGPNPPDSPQDRY